MAVPTSYLNTVGNVDRILAAIQKAGVPDRFTHEFLQKQLGFGSSGDRPIIHVLKALRFLDDSGVPLDRYRHFKDPKLSGAVMAEALRDAYADVFAADQRAEQLSRSELVGLFGRLSGKGEAVAIKMAQTFQALARHADFNALPGEQGDEVGEGDDADVDTHADEPKTPSRHAAKVTLHHDVHIHLPVSTDIAVYDAIFRSMSEHLGT